MPMSSAVVILKVVTILLGFLTIILVGVSHSKSGCGGTKEDRRERESEICKSLPEIVKESEACTNTYDKRCQAELGFREDISFEKFCLSMTIIFFLLSIGDLVVCILKPELLNPIIDLIYHAVAIFFVTLGGILMLVSALDLDKPNRELLESCGTRDYCEKNFATYRTVFYHSLKLAAGSLVIINGLIIYSITAYFIFLAKSGGGGGAQNNNYQPPQEQIQEQPSQQITAPEVNPSRPSQVQV